VAVKVAEAAAAGTVTEAATGSRALLLERETVAPPVGAALVRVTVQVLTAPEARLAGLHASEERVTGTTSEIVAVDRPLREAVIVAVSLPIKLSAVATNVALLALAGIVSEEGTVRSGILEVMPTVAPPVPAVPLRVTLQVEEPAGLREPGPQLRELTLKIVWTVPLIADVAMACPAMDAPMALLTVMGADVTFGASVTSTVAAIPLEIVLVFSPVARHV
jgi:hypothetical protein